MANVTINGLTSKASPVSTDELEIQETGAGDSKKVTLAAIKTTNAQTAGEVPIVDSGALITATEVEGALAENRALIDAKVTNATHTGDVTGDEALTIDPTAISGKAEVTAVGADHVMILDATDGELKKALASDLGGASPTHTGDVTGDTALTVDPTAISGKAEVTAVGADHFLILDATDDTLKKALVSDVGGGGGAGRQTYLVRADAVTPTVTNGAGYIVSAETTALRPDLRSVKFDTDADEHVQFGISFPDQWDKGTLTYDYTWEGLAATTGVAFALMAVAVADNETFDVDFGTPVVVTDAAQGAVEENNTSAESAALTVAGSPANGKMIIFDFYRDVSDGSDDMPGDAGLVSLNIYWTQTATTDD